MRVFYTSASGREITLAYWNPGNFVGGPDVLNAGTHMWSGVTATETQVLMLPSRELRQLILEIPALAIGIIEGLSFKGKCYSALAQILGTRSVSERLAHLLLQLAEIYGQPTKNGIFIDAAFTHVDLAHIVGATRQWVTMMLKRLQVARRGDPAAAARSTSSIATCCWRWRSRTDGPRLSGRHAPHGAP